MRAGDPPDGYRPFLFGHVAGLSGAKAAPPGIPGLIFSDDDGRRIRGRRIAGKRCLPLAGHFERYDG